MHDRAAAQRPPHQAAPRIARSLRPACAIRGPGAQRAAARRAAGNNSPSSWGSQRKVLHCAFKRNLTTDVKVAQLAGYVGEHAAYHHGEASLNGTIIGLAQDYCGARNINLLVPSGQCAPRDARARTRVCADATPAALCCALL
jgi:hypothetical protein